MFFTGKQQKEPAKPYKNFQNNTFFFTVPLQT